MDPVSIIVTALATGAAAGLKPTAEKVIQDAYAGVKKLIKRKYDRVDVEAIEKDPASAARQSVVEEELQKTEAGHDEELLRQAKALLDAVAQHAPEAAGAVGVSLEDVKAASLRIEEVIASGTGVHVKGSEFSGDIDIRGVRAGNGHPKG